MTKVLVLVLEGPGPVTRVVIVNKPSIVVVIVVFKTTIEGSV